MNTKITALFLSMLMGGVSLASAQSYDDDDIYFNPSKAKAPVKEKKVTPAKTNGVILYPATDYPAADSYTVPEYSSRSVDEYNRRGIFADDKPAASDSISADAFANTRKIERFYNPEIVKGTQDEELAQYYYAEPANINIIINTPDYWGYPYYGRAWAWGNPWYWGGWGPSWGWGPGWGWGASWGPAWGWTAPSRRPGAVGNIRPAYAGRPGNAAGYRPGRGSGTINNSGYRPGRGNVRGTINNNSDYNNRYKPTSRPGNSNQNNNGYRPGNTRGSSWGTGTSGGGGMRGGFGGGGSRGGGGGRGRH